MENIHKKYTFSLLGGDRRQDVIANELIKRGHRVKLFGLAEYSLCCSGAEIYQSAEKAIAEGDVIILPLPVTRDNNHLSAQSVLKLDEIIKLATKYNVKHILGGIMPVEFTRCCNACGIDTYDYYKDLTLQEKNALPSAEGALMIAMENTEITVSGMKVLISGYGRIGSLLASILKNLGASVTVAVRRDEVLCDVLMSGYKATKIDLSSASGFAANENYDVIFNTVPNIIFTDKVIEGIKNKPLYIEIASQPGGIDITQARKAGIKTVFAPSLPGKYSPISAGRYIFETISEMLSEGGIII